MTATTSLSFEMADDSMDVVSDYGNAANEDIDIDIDLSAEQQNIEDEDTMIEDEPPYVDAETEDVMIEDDQESYQMDDVVDEHYEVDVDDVPIDDVPVTDDQILEDAASVEHTTAEEPEGEVDNTSDIGWEEPEPLQASQDNDVAAQPAVEEISEPTRDDEEPLSSTSVLGTSVHEVNEEAKLPQEVTETNESSLEPVGANTQASADKLSDEADQSATKELLLEDEGYSLQRTSEGDFLESHEAAAVAATADEEDQTAIGNDKVNATVAYHGVEYALISRVDGDDPDNYFFKDASLIRQSLTELFEGLRTVLQEEIADGDELRLSIPDLGVDFTESTAPSIPYTFAALVQLHSRLLINDKIDSPGPMYVLLESGSCPTRRLQYLISGADEGKGLSELQTWDLEETVFEDDNREEEHDEKNDIPLQPEDVDTGGQHDEERSAELGESEYNNSSGANAPVADDNDQSNGVTNGEIDDHSGTSAVVKSEAADITARPDQVDSASPNANLTVESDANADTPNEVLDHSLDYKPEEEDILDYSDEEDQNQPLSTEDQENTQVDSLISEQADGLADEGSKLNVPDATAALEHKTKSETANHGPVEIALVDDQEPDHADEIDYAGTAPEIESNSEATLVGDEHIPAQSVDADNDEIDYDDDDGLNFDNSTVEDVSGKRSYAELEDETDLPQQDSKRVRS